MTVFDPEKRESGWYWVKVFSFTRWVPAYWDCKDRSWEHPFAEGEITKIGTRIKVRKEDEVFSDEECVHNLQEAEKVYAKSGSKQMTAYYDRLIWNLLGQLGFTQTVDFLEQHSGWFKRD